MRVVINLLLVAIFLLVAYQVSATLGSGDLFGFQYKGQDVSFETFLLISLATLVGAMIGSIYAYIGKKGNENTPWWTLLRDAVRSQRFGMSLIITPLVVFVVFDQIDLKNADLGIALFCLQSGFFWDRTIDAVAGRERGVPNRSAGDSD